jgi:hypothetical protein
VSQHAPVERDIDNKIDAGLGAGWSLHAQALNMSFRIPPAYLDATFGVLPKAASKVPQALFHNEVFGHYRTYDMFFARGEFVNNKVLALATGGGSRSKSLFYG